MSHVTTCNAKNAENIEEKNCNTIRTMYEPVQ